MKKLGIIVGVIVLVLVVIVAVLPFVVDVNTYHDRIQSELEKRTGRPVQLGHMDLRVFPFAIRVQDFSIGDDPAFQSGKPFAESQALYVSLKLWPLITSKDVQVRSLELTQPKIELIRNAQGVWNFSTLGKNTQQANAAHGVTLGQKQQTPAKPQAQPQPSSQPQKPGSTQPEFSLASLEIADGQVAITDSLKHQPRTVYDHIDLRLNDFAPGKPFSFDLAAHLPGTGSELLRVKGDGGPIAEEVTQTPFKGNVEMKEVSLGGLRKFMSSSAATEMEGSASGSADIHNTAGKIGASGNLELSDAKIRGVQIGYPIAADFDFNADLNADQLQISKGKLKLGQTPVDVSGSVDMKPTPAVLDVAVKAQNASIAEIARLAGAFGVAFNPGTDVKGSITADIKARGAADHPQLNGTVSARNVEISGKQVKQPVKADNIQLQLDPLNIRSNQFMASTGGTNVKVQFTLGNYAGGNSSIDAAASASNAQLGEVLDIAKAYGLSAAEGMSGSGAVSFDVHAQGGLKDPNGLNYSGSGKLQNASLTVPELTKPIRVANTDLRFSQNAVMLDNLQFGVGQTNANGNVTLRNLSPSATPEMQFTLNADRFDALEWQQMVKAEPQAAKQTENFSLIPVAHAQAPQRAVAAQPTMFSRMVGHGNLSIGTVTQDQLQLNNVKAAVVLDHGVIRLSPYTAQLYGGQTTGTVVIDTRPAQTTYSINSKVDKVDANKLLSSVSNLKQTLFGILGVNADAGFVSSQSSNLASTLNGRVSMNLANGKLAGLDMLNQLSAIGKFAGFAQNAQPFTNIAQMAGHFDIRNGVARTDDLKATIDGGTLAATGTVNLASQSLDLHVLTVLDKAFSQKVGGNSIGGFMSTALANKDGELVMPVLVTGTFSSPRVAPDVETIAKMKLQNLLPSGNNPAALGGLLGNILGGKNQQQTSPNQQNQTAPNQTNANQPQQQQAKPNANDLLQGIMGALGNKQQKKPQQPAQPQQQPQNPPPH
jgi:uncharacterized protein involved in outer membrane biogenesis